MNYYILPRSNIPLHIFFSYDSQDTTKFLSHTLIHSLYNIKLHMKDYNANETIETSKYINPGEFIFRNVPETFLSISKLKVQTNMYYELTEILQTTFLLESVFFNKNINVLHLGNDTLSTKLLIDTVRDSYDDTVYIDTFETFSETSVMYDFIIFECIDNQIRKLIQSLNMIINSLNKNGSVIFKLSGLYSKVTIECLFILTNMFHNVYLIKPVVSNILSDDKYVVCLHYKNNTKNACLTVKNYDSLSSILKTQLPLFFLTKIEEFNAVYGQQQLEAYDHLINVMNNKHKYDKMDTLKKINIQKGILWCEKYSIPCNKFIEKVNIFMNVKCDEMIDSK
jgi:hypothetical protein